MNKSAQQRAKLRVCASCEWIYKGKGECPKCMFGSYGARYVYGNKAYEYAVTQKPWKDQKMFEYETKLNKEIKKDEQSTRNTRLIGNGQVISLFNV